jgi:hypothetical protein
MRIKTASITLVVLTAAAAGTARAGDLARDYATLVAVFPEDRAGLGLDPGGATGDQPMTYGLVVAAESLRAARTPDAEPRRRARKAVRWLLDNRDLDGDGKPGWGLPDAWDAAADGSVNPPHTCYTITTAIVLEGLVQSLAVPELWSDDEAREIRGVVRDVLLRWCRELWAEGYGGGYYRYSTADDFFSINAPAMMLSPQARFLERHEHEFSAADRELVRARLDGLAAAVVHTVERRGGAPFWDYMAVPNRLNSKRPNDAVHQAYILWGIETYREHGGRVPLPWTTADAVASLDRFWADGKLYFFARDEPGLSAGRAAQPANLWGSGLILACVARWGSREQVARSVAALVEAHGPLPRQREYPAWYRDDPHFYPRHAAHVLLGLAEAAFGPRP